MHKYVKTYIERVAVKINDEMPFFFVTVII